jgi:Icc-related predicted phosphoesterase
MKIVAVADVHCPRYVEEFIAGLEQVDKPHLFLMAGDMVNRGMYDQYPIILEHIKEKLGDGFPIYSCFGNEEYSEVRKEILSLVGQKIKFLDEKLEILDIAGLKVGIVGTQGSLDKPTSWQKRNIPSVKRVFEQRAERAALLLRKMEGKVDRRILLMHYSPCLETCEGESTRSFAWLGSRKFFSVIKSEQPDLVIHGHVHNSTNHETMIGNSRVRNVSIPAVGSLTQLDL